MSAEAHGQDPATLIAAQMRKRPVQRLRRALNSPLMCPLRQSCQW
jgi:hypothetical protein